MATKLVDAVKSATRLTTSLAQGRCVLFVGSGLSVPAGYKSWAGLIQTLVDEAKKLPQARTKGIEEFEKEKDYFTLAEFARSALGLNQFTSVLKTEYGKKSAPTPAHEAIAKTNYRGIITTNYDRLLETVFTQVRGWVPNSFTTVEVSAMAEALYNSDPFIFKLHGDITNPASLILTATDYDRTVLRSPHIRSFLQAIFLNSTLLFVGYGIRDPDFQLVLKELTLIFEGYTPTHYAMLPNAPDFAVEDLLRRMNIQVLPYDPHDNHVEVTETLQELQTIAPYKS